MVDQRELRHFRRRHRLTEHTVLFAGPYSKEGGLLFLLDAAPALREQVDDLVVAAIPVGGVDPSYRDLCERRALALGHRGIVEWEVTGPERELWEAAACLVIRPETLAQFAGSSHAESLAGYLAAQLTPADSVLSRI